MVFNSNALGFAFNCTVNVFRSHHGSLILKHIVFAIFHKYILKIVLNVLNIGANI